MCSHMPYSPCVVEERSLPCGSRWCEPCRAGTGSLENKRDKEQSCHKGRSAPESPQPALWHLQAAGVSWISLLLTSPALVNSKPPALAVCEFSHFIGNPRFVGERQQSPVWGYISREGQHAHSRLGSALKQFHPAAGDYGVTTKITTGNKCQHVCSDKHWRGLRPLTTDVVNVSPTQLHFIQSLSWETSL